MLISENELESQNLQEFEELLKEYVKLKPTKVLEIGSLYGWTLQHFIFYAEKNSTIVSIDFPVRNFVGPYDPRVEKQEYNYKHVWPKWAKGNQCKLYLIPDQSQQPLVLEQAKNIFNNEPIDFIFIDGDHTYEGVKRDYEMYAPLLKKGGAIAFHDIGKNEEGGVSRLWEELKTKYKNVLEICHEPNQQKGIGVIYT